MRRQDQEPADEPLLFDLPMEPERAERKRASRPPAAPVSSKPTPSPGFDDFDGDEPDLGSILDDTIPGVEPDHDPSRAGVGSRLAAGAADLLVHAAVGVAVLLGTRSMGIRPVLADWPALALFLLSFSFLYTVVPLAFWGHTPGMAFAGLDARSRDGEPLAFDQTARRWLGGVLTSLLLGLPLLLALGGRSLGDLLSSSETLSNRATR